MKFIKVLIILAEVFSITQAFSALGQSQGTWIIPPGGPSHITPGYLDSLNLVLQDPTNPPGFNVREDSIWENPFIGVKYTYKTFLLKWRLQTKFAWKNTGSS